MSNTLAICRKELRSYAVTPIGRVLLLISVGFFGLMVYAASNDTLRFRIAVPVFAITFFRPSRELVSHPVSLVVGFARVIAMYMIPMITMRLFPEEKQTRTIELLLTSPVNEIEIVLGKWLAAFFLYLLLISVGVVEFAIRSWDRPDWTTILICYSALSVVGGSLLAVGECISTFTRHQPIAAAATLVIAVAVLRYSKGGVLGPAALLVSIVLMTVGWFCTFRSVRALRETY